MATTVIIDIKESPTTMTTTPDASTTLQEIRVATSDSILTTISTTSTTGQVINEGALQTEVDTISGIVSQSSFKFKDK